ncbi:MAG: hypothetical protein COB12_06450 [Flavobacterium sp.]|nr:MAG: hypothetical protein COB12_06450 [Flavobacterium sp.]
MHKSTLTILVFCLLTLNGFNQINAITEKGDTIFVYNNGTWKSKPTIKKPESIKSSVEATVTIDDFSNKKSINTKNWTSFGISTTKTKLTGFATYYNDGVYAVKLTLASDLGCMSNQRSTLKVKLSNDEVIEFIQVSKTDCSNSVFATFAPITEADLKNENYMDLIKENVDILKQYDWVTIRIQGSEYYIDITPRITKKTPNPEQFFRQHFTSISNKL